MVYLDKLIIFLLFNFSSANENNITVYWASLVAQMMKNSPAIQETWVHFLSKEDHLEKGKAAAVAAKSHQSCPTLCDPINGSPPGSPVPGILQARTLEWVAISFSSEWKWKVKVKSISRVRLFQTWWTVAYQAPPSMGFPRQEYWSGLPLPSPRERLPTPISLSGELQRATVHRVTKSQTRLRY